MPSESIKETVGLQIYEVGSTDAELDLIYSVQRFPAAQLGEGGAHIPRMERLGLKSENFSPHSSEKERTTLYVVVRVHMHDVIQTSLSLICGNKMPTRCNR